MISRLIVILYSSFELSGKSNEEFHIKIYEILSNFIYVYCISNKAHVKSIIKSVMIIISSHLFNTNYITYEKNVYSDYLETKFEFLNQLMILVNENSLNKTSVKSIIFKVFKYLVFVYYYINEDHQKMLKNEETNTKGKKIDISLLLRKNLNNNIKKIFERTKYDIYLLNEMIDEDYLKLFPYLHKMNESGLLKSFSENLFENYKKLKENGLIYENNGNKFDLSNNEKLNDIKINLDHNFNKEDEGLLVLNDKIDNFGIDDEEEIFKQIIEMSKKEYDEKTKVDEEKK